MAGDNATDIAIRGRCVCGRRYRIHHARADLIVTCPGCRRAITITDADMRAAAAGEALEPLVSETTEILEAIPLDDGIRLAAHGGRPGATGELVQTDESILQGLGSRRVGAGEPAAPAPEELAVLPEQELRSSFTADLMSTFYLAGKWRNAVSLLVTATVFTLALLAIELTGTPILGALLTAVLVLMAFAYVVQFYWRTLSMTAAGEDEIPMVPPNWSLWEDVMLPAVWIMVASAACLGPSFLVSVFMPAGPEKILLSWATLALGSIVWPVAIMSIALGQSIVYLRPDWLVRCIVGIGPMYFLAWALTMLAIVAPAGLEQLIPPQSTLGGRFAHVLGMQFAQLYFGYAVFRIIGVLFRYYRHRLPWKF